MVAKKKAPKKVREKRESGKKFTKSQKEALYQGLYKYHTLQGLPMSQCSELLNVAYQSVRNHMPKYVDWLKKQFPEDFDTDYQIKRFLKRAEDRALMLQNESLKEGIASGDIARLLREAAREDDRVIRLLQDARKLPSHTRTHRDVEMSGDALVSTTEIFVIDTTGYDKKDGRKK